MPNWAFNKMGFKKADVINLCGTMAELDFSDSLHKVSCPVLIVCGEKDNANKKTAKELCHYLNNSNFHELMKTGHEANIEAPEGFIMSEKTEITFMQTRLIRLASENCIRRN